MAARTECCRYEPSLEDLLADEVMVTVLRSAGFDQQGFRAMIAETARRIDDRRGHNPLDDPWTVRRLDHGSDRAEC